ncbi:MAG: glycosyltransferase [Lutibacter sp.]|nr:glycosyltransferase [Lutibacter sp.]
MKISVIIPTYNRAKMLGITIESFVNQNYPKDKFEIVVVNNNSTDNTEDILKDYSAKFPNFRYFNESRQGVHYARNTAAKHTNGEILYYTDDDMIADQYLLSEIIKPFMMNDKIATATGRVLPKWEVPPPKWILDYCFNGLLSLNNPPEDLIISSVDCNIYSCHQAIRKDVFFQTGGFNPENTAGEWIGDGETGLNIKMKDLGYKFAYNGKSIIYHMIPPTRMTQSYLNKRMANQGNCDSYTAYKKHIFSKTKLIIKIVSHFKNYFIYALKGMLKFLFLKPTWRLSWSKSYYYLNRIKYDYRLIKEEEWRKIVLRENWI